MSLSNNTVLPVQLDLFIPEDRLLFPIPHLRTGSFSVREARAWLKSYMKSGTRFMIDYTPPAGNGGTNSAKPSPSWLT